LASSPHSKGLPLLGSPLKSQRIISRLQEFYGDIPYNKTVQLAKKPKPNSLGDNLPQSPQALAADGADDSMGRLQTINLSEELGDTVKGVNDDLDYLDALASHDALRLNKFSPGRESLGAIFCEIVENEHQTTTNFQEAVFEKNIQFIFNSEVDLDEWKNNPHGFAAGAQLPKSGTLAEEPFNQPFQKRLSSFSFYEKTAKRHAFGRLGKTGAYYATVWISLAAIAVTFAWLLVG